MATCNSSDSILEAAADIKANGLKIAKFTHGTSTENVQLGTGAPTPVLRNVVRQIFSAASQIEGSDASGKTVLSNGSSEYRTLAERFTDVINVKDFGAKGDGTTPDTTAFQNALDLQAQTGAAIYVPAGTYLCGALTYSGKVVLFGDNVLPTSSGFTNTSTVIVFSGTSGSLLSSDETAGSRGTEVKGIAFQGSGGTGFKCYTSGGNRNITFSNCHFKGFDVGLQISDAYNNKISGCVFVDCNVGVEYKSINWANTSSTTGDIIENCYFGSCDTAGIKAKGINTATLINDVFEYNGYGALADDSYRVTFIGCYFEGNISGGVHMPRGTAINCFAHASLGVNTIDFTTTGVVNYLSRISAVYSGSEIFSVTPGTPTKSRITRPYIRGTLRLMGDTVDDNIYLDGSNDLGFLKITIQGTTSFQFQRSAFKPYEADTVSLGASGQEWKELYCLNPSITPSDERMKDNVADFSDELLDAWEDVRLVVFQFKDALEKKGANARIHAGVIAQQVQSVFAARGLDAFRLGLLCYDEWEDEYEDVEVVDAEAVLNEMGEEVSPAVSHKEQRKIKDAGDRFSVRYTEALVVEAAYQRRRADRIEARVAALEARLNEISGNSLAPSDAE